MKQNVNSLINQGFWKCQCVTPSFIQTEIGFCDWDMFHKHNKSQFHSSHFVEAQFSDLPEVWCKICKPFFFGIQHCLKRARKLA